MASSVVLRACLLFLALFLGNALGAIQWGTVSTAKSRSFEYLDKFCYDFTPPSPTNEPSGAVELLITAADPSRPIEGLEDLQFWMFDDEDSSWPAMEYRRMSCAKRESYSRGIFPIHLTPAANASAADGIAAGQPVYRHTFDISQHIRPRFWWFGLVNCKNRFGNLRWKLHMYNFNSGSVNKEFGVNERYIGLMYPIFLTFFIAISAAHLYGIWAQRDVLSTTERSNFKIHQVVMLFTISLLLMTAAIFCKQVHYSLYSFNGIGIRFLSRVADVADAISRVQFTMLIMLLASGWTISAATTSNKRLINNSLTLFGCIYVFMLLARFLLESDYVTVPLQIAAALHMLVAAWVIIALWFAVTIAVSFRREYKPHKRAMYLRLGFVYTFWLLSEPTSVFLTLFLSPWVRDKIVVGVSLPLSIIAFGWMAYLLWPSRASKYFMLDLPEVTDEFLTSNGDGL